MKLNHANLVTTDVVGLAAFFTRHFGFELLSMRGKNAFAILRGSDGFALNLMLPGKGEQASYPGGFHVGFLVERLDQVLAKHEELSAAGFETSEVQALTRAGAASTIFYSRTPCGILVEVSTGTG